MTTKIYEFHGKSHFAKVFDKGDERFQTWKIGVILDKPSQMLFDKSGLRLKEKKTPDGEVYYDFRRPWSKLIGKDMVEFPAPEIFEADGTTKTTELIGNGSEVVTRISVYDTRMGKAHRLESVRIKELVPYNKVEVIVPEGYEFELPPV